MTDPLDERITTIGLFDSGVGGLSVLRQLARLSTYNGDGASPRFIYLGDTARCPYGDRPQTEISSFVRQIVTWLAATGAQAIVMACNTSAALAGAVARTYANVPVYDLIAPTAAYVAGSGKMNVGVLATASTVRSGAFSRAIRSLNPDQAVLEVACPELVPIVESGRIYCEEARAVLSSYARQLIEAEVEAVVLGCTHYPFLTPLLSKMLPAGVVIIDPAEQLLGTLTGASAVEPAEIDHRAAPWHDTTTFFVTGCPSQFRDVVSICTRGIPATISAISIAELEGIADIAEGAIADMIPPVVSEGVVQGALTP